MQLPRLAPRLILALGLAAIVVAVLVLRGAETTVRAGSPAAVASGTTRPSGTATAEASETVEVRATETATPTAELRDTETATATLEAKATETSTPTDPKPTDTPGTPSFLPPTETAVPTSTNTPQGTTTAGPTHTRTSTATPRADRHAHAARDEHWRGWHGRAVVDTDDGRPGRGRDTAAAGRGVAGDGEPRRA